MKQPLLLMSALMLIGCQPKSEVDKCVQEFLEMNEPYSSADERDNMEVAARFKCMKVYGGENKE